MRRLLAALLGLLVCVQVQASNYLSRNGFLYDPSTGYLVGYIGLTDGREYLFVNTIGLTAAQIPQTGWLGVSTVDDALAAANSNQYVWQDTTGQIKYTADSGAKTITTTIQGRLLGTQFIASGTSTFTTGASTKYVDLELQCGGGSGAGSAAPGAGNGSVGGGGGAGGWLKAGHIAVTPSTAYNVTLPAGGSATSGGTDGNTASDCTVTIGATTYTAKGGNGGKFLAAQATIGKALGGAPTAASTNGDINGAGAPGGIGLLTAANGAAGYGGQGGSSPWGGGGNNVGSTAGGGACTGLGSGGGGALSGASGAAQNGAAGCPSGLYVREYSGT